MTHRWVRLARRCSPLVAGGFLLQANGCALGSNELVEGLILSLANTLIADLVFGFFSVPLSGF